MDDMERSPPASQGPPKETRQASVAANSPPPAAHADAASPQPVEDAESGRKWQEADEEPVADGHYEPL